MKIEHWTPKGESFTWIDITNPTHNELVELAHKHDIEESQIAGCLDPEHMPRTEIVGDFRSIILRGYDAEAPTDGLTVHKLTRKLVLFVGPRTFLTVHRTDLPYLAPIKAQLTSNTLGKVTTKSLLNEILAAVVHTYDEPMAHLLSTLSQLEDRTFHPTAADSLLAEGYYLRRKASVFSHMMTLMSEAVHSVAASYPKNQSHSFSYLAERCDRLSFHASELTVNIDNLINLHLTIIGQKTNEASQRSNEVMRLLTVVSIFFLPLNLIAGIYGMNFENMPELKNPDGYQWTLMAMALIAFAILIWFWRRGWLSPIEDGKNDLNDKN